MNKTHSAKHGRQVKHKTKVLLVQQPRRSLDSFHLPPGKPIEVVYLVDQQLNVVNLTKLKIRSRFESTELYKQDFPSDEFQ